MRERKDTAHISAEQLAGLKTEKRVPRARNRTIMLGAEETSDVRERFHAHLHAEEENDGFVSLSNLGKYIEDQISEDSSVFLTDSEEEFEQETVNLKEVDPEINSAKDKFVAISSETEKQVSIEESRKIFDNVSAELVNQTVVSNIESELAQTEKKNEPVIIEEIMIKNNLFEAVWAKTGKLRGFLVSFMNKDTGEYLPLYEGRLIVTSAAAAGGNYLLINNDSVSVNHAVLRISSEPEIQILDQLSERGTRIQSLDGRIQELLGDKSVIKHGDLVYFGDVVFHVCLIT
jgi:hypothetical protein